jgi:streptogramin lyase
VQRRTGRLGRRHRWAALGAVVAAVIAVAASIVDAGRGSGAPGPEISLPGRPIESTAGSKSVWILTCAVRCNGTGRNSKGQLIRIDPASGTIASSARVRSPHAFAVGVGAVWLIDSWRSTLTRMSPSGAVQATIALELPRPITGGDRNFLPFDVAVGEGSIWVSTARGYIAQVDPASNTVVKTITVPAESTGAIAAGNGAIWVAQSGVGSLLRIDPKTGDVRPLSVMDANGRTLATSTLALAGGSLVVSGTWASRGALTNDASIAVIETRTGVVTHRTATSGSPSALLTGGGRVWLASNNGRTIRALNPATGTISERALSSPGTVVGITGGTLWVAYADGTLRATPVPW